MVLTGLCGYSETSKQAAKQYIFPTPYVPAASTAAGGGSGDGSAAGTRVCVVVITCIFLVRALYHTYLRAAVARAIVAE